MSNCSTSLLACKFLANPASFFFSLLAACPCPGSRMLTNRHHHGIFKDLREGDARKYMPPAGDVLQLMKLSN